MLSSILAFIKAKAVIIAITSTVVVTTAVATPIVINEVKKQNQNAEVVKNQVETVVSDNTEDNSTKVEETKEEIVMGEAVDKELIDSDDPEAWKTDVNVKTPAQKEDEKKMQEAVEQANKSKEFRVEFMTDTCGSWIYKGTIHGEVTVYSSWVSTPTATREQFLNETYYQEKQRLVDLRARERQRDINYGNISSVDINQINSKIKELTASRDKANRASAYYQSNKETIVPNDQGTFQFEGSYYVCNADAINSHIIQTNQDLDRYKQMKNEYNPNEIGKLEQEVIDALATLETAYNYIKTH